MFLIIKQKEKLFNNNKNRNNFQDIKSPKHYKNKKKS